MNRLPMSAAGAALLRAVLNRAAVNRDRILLTEFQSTDWQSLTFTGERHVFQLNVPGEGAAAVAARLTEGIADAEFAIAGHIVADIEARSDSAALDGSIAVRIEALTVMD